MIPTQVIDVPFTAGVDTKSDAKLTAKLARLENYCFRGGTLRKRDGSVAFSSTILDGSSLASCEGLGVYSSELLTASGGQLYGYSAGATGWKRRGIGEGYTNALGGSNTPQSPIFSKTVRQRLVRSTTDIADADIASDGNYTVHAWIETSGYAFYSVQDEATGTFLRQRVYLTNTAAHIRVILVGAVFWVMYSATSNSGIICKQIASATPLASSSVTLLSSGLGTSKRFDAVTFGSGVALAYSTGTDTTFSLARYDSTGTVILGPQSVGSDTRGLTLATDGTAFYTLDSTLNTSTYGTYRVFSASLGAVGSTQLGLSVAFDHATLTPKPSGNATITDAMVGFIELGNASQASTSPGNVIILLHGQANGTASVTVPSAVGTGPFWRNGSLATRAVSASGKVWVGIIFVSSVQQTAFVLAYDGLGASPLGFGEMDLTQMAAKMLPGVAEYTRNYVGVTSVAPKPCSALVLPNGKLVFVFGEKGRTRYSSGTFTWTGTSPYIVDLSPRGITRFTMTLGKLYDMPINRIGQALYIGGAMPLHYDGNAPVETGFPTFPESAPSWSSTAGGSGAIEVGTRQYRAVFRWTDANGELHQSAPSVAVTVQVSVAFSTTTIVFPAPPFTKKTAINTCLSISIFRTANNGTTFYLVNGSASPISPYTSTYSFADTTSDVNLVSNELLYTTGGVLDSIAPPSYTMATVFKGRLVITGLEDPYAVRYSTQYVPGESVRFNEALGFTVPAETGIVTGVAVLDDKLVIFTTLAIYVVAGDGPNNLGLQNSFSQPTRVASDTGCNATNSIVTAPDGVYFMGNQGICILSRALDVQYVGADVEAYSGYTFRSATLLGTLDEVRFQCDAGSGFGDTCLVYNYHYDQWSVFTAFGAVAVAYYNGAYIRGTAGGTILQETASATTDAGGVFVGTIETAWLKLTGLQGFQRVKRALLLGQLVSDLVFTWEAAYDYDATYNSLDMVTVATAGTWAVGKPLQARRHLRIQKCEAIRFRITVSGESSPFGGMALTGMALEVAAKQGHFRGLPAGKSF